MKFLLLDSVSLPFLNGSLICRRWTTVSTLTLGLLKRGLGSIDQWKSRRFGVRSWGINKFFTSYLIYTFIEVILYGVFQFPSYCLTLFIHIKYSLCFWLNTSLVSLYILFLSSELSCYLFPLLIKRFFLYIYRKVTYFFYTLDWVILFPFNFGTVLWIKKKLDTSTVYSFPTGHQGQRSDTLCSWEWDDHFHVLLCLSR